MVERVAVASGWERKVEAAVSEEVGLEAAMVVEALATGVVETVKGEVVRKGEAAAKGEVVMALVDRVMGGVAAAMELVTEASVMVGGATAVTMVVAEVGVGVAGCTVAASRQ